MTLIAWLVYAPLQIVWLPISLIGALLVAYRQILVSKRLGVSQTAGEIINGRWTMDVVGLRDDEASRRLAETIANTSTFGLWLALLPLWIAARIAGKPFVYLTLQAPEAAVQDTLAAAKSHTAPGRVIVADFYRLRFLAIGRGKRTSKLVVATGEGCSIAVSAVFDVMIRALRFVRAPLCLDRSVQSSVDFWTGWSNTACRAPEPCWQSGATDRNGQAMTQVPTRRAFPASVSGGPVVPARTNVRAYGAPRTPAGTGVGVCPATRAPLLLAHDL